MMKFINGNIQKLNIVLFAGKNLNHMSQKEKQGKYVLRNVR